MKVSELLTKTADKLEAPGAWIQGSLAKDRYGNFVPAVHPTAICWCLEGGFRSFQPDHKTYTGALHRLVDVGIFDHVQFNDSFNATQAIVVGYCREAAQHAIDQGV